MRQSLIYQTTVFAADGIYAIMAVRFAGFSYSSAGTLPPARPVVS